MLEFLRDGFNEQGSSAVAAKRDKGIAKAGIGRCCCSLLEILKTFGVPCCVFCVLCVVLLLLLFTAVRGFFDLPAILACSVVGDGNKKRVWWWRWELPFSVVDKSDKNK